MANITATINIGREIGGTGYILKVSTVVQEIERAGIELRAMRMIESDTEPTVVAEVVTDAMVAFDVLACALGQDCIGVVASVDGKPVRELRGPRAEAWGGFNADYFFTLDGRRLREVEAAGA